MTKMSTPTIIVASDNTGDAALVKKLLGDEFNNVFASTDPDKSAADFVCHPPDVLVLAFNTLDKSQHYYLRLSRLCAAVHLHPHRTLILCNKDELRQAYALCRDEVFDDYILFWPMVHDALRLPMSVHLALRELAVLRDGRPTPADFAAQAPHLESVRSLNAMAERVRPTVLVVDDDEFQHKIVSKILDDENYHLVFAAGGVEALSVLRKTRPDLILMDLMMPDMDGLEVMRQMKTVPRLANIPVIMITGKGEKDVITESQKVGVIDFMVKPYARNTLLGKVAKVLRGT